MEMIIFNSKCGGYNEVRFNSIVPSIKVRWVAGAKSNLPLSQRHAANASVQAAKLEAGEEIGYGLMANVRDMVKVTF